MFYQVCTLHPINDHHKSFYGKAKFVKTPNYEILFSYNTPIMVYDKEHDRYYRWWDGGYTITRNCWGSIVPFDRDWSPTTGRHIKEFSGLNKKEYMSLSGFEELPIQEQKYIRLVTDEYLATVNA